MTELHSPEGKKPTLIDQLRDCVGVAREGARTAWAGMGKKETLELYLGGGAAAIVGLLLTLGIRAFVPDMWPIEGYGDFLAFGGLGSMGVALSKMIDLAIKNKDYVPERFPRQRLR